MSNQNIPEIDVIIAVAVWLNLNGCTLKRISIPNAGKNLADKEKLISKLSATGISTASVNFKSAGPDIVASFNGSEWKIECKGLGGGRIQTLRNNFDRALASTVSYYTSETGIRLGLAMPNCSEYVNFMTNKIPKSLRKVLDLWIFLTDSGSVIEVIKPDEQIPCQHKDENDAEWV